MKKVIVLVGVLILAMLVYRMFPEPHIDNVSKRGQFISVSGESLSGKKYSFPQDFTRERTLVLFAYERERADALRSWVEGLELLTSEVAWFEMPVISTPYQWGRFVIDNGMRQGIPDTTMRDHVVTLYTDRERFAASLGIPYNQQGAYAMVLDSTGRCLGYVEGDFSSEKSYKIRALLQPR